MERGVSIVEAKEIFGSNFIGPLESEGFVKRLNIDVFNGKYPDISYSLEDLVVHSQRGALLVLIYNKTREGKSISLPMMRDIFGLDPKISEPCFYNQDWYLNERFYLDETLTFEWRIIYPNILHASRGQVPSQDDLSSLPSALLCSYVFFICFFYNNNIIWKNDYVWCSDIDSGGDRIYVGRYFDPKGLNKNGFSLHRHLSIKMNYGMCGI